MNDFITNVSKFMEAAGQTEGEFNVRQTALYLGLQCEELAEKLKAADLWGHSGYIDSLGRDLKMGAYDFNVKLANSRDMLDADVDLLWVTVGAALSAGFDLRGAMDEVTRSNMSKLVDGKMLKDENGKVTKPEHFSPPLLEPFVCKK